MFFLCFHHAKSKTKFVSARFASVAKIGARCTIAWRFMIQGWKAIQSEIHLFHKKPNQHSRQYLPFGLKGFAGCDFVGRPAPVRQIHASRPFAWKCMDTINGIRGRSAFRGWLKVKLDAAGREGANLRSSRMKHANDVANDNISISKSLENAPIK